MLKYALIAVAAAMVLAVGFVLLPIHSGPRQEPRLLASGDAAPVTNFTVRDAARPTPVPSPTPAPTPGDLDSVMQRLRNGKPDAPVAAATPSAPPVAPPAVPPPAPPPAPAPAADALITPVAPDPAAPIPPSATRWGSVTSQGTRWRMARTGGGYTVSIDLGGGQTANVHVQPAFANLDPAAVNVRVDYLRDTILQNFSRQSGSYTFARDGSVSAER